MRTSSPLERWLVAMYMTCLMWMTDIYVTFYASDTSI